MPPLVQIQKLFTSALSALLPDPQKLPDYLGMIKPAGNPEHGDYQANMAMPLAKILGVKPHEVAQRIIAALPQNQVIASASVAGPGFINLKLTESYLSENLRMIAADERLGIPRVAKPLTIVIDYSSPNVAKPLHVGHLRSTIIGDALTRLHRFLGHRVITDNHLGDWGTQFGMLIYGYRHYLNKEAYQKDPIRELARVYVEVRKAGGDDEDETFNPVKAAYRAETAKLHAGDAENLKLWNEFMPHCLADLQTIYDRLGILPFDYIHGESFYAGMQPGVVEDLLAKQVAEHGEGGAVIVRIAKDKVAIVRKKDGAFTYTTSDLATIQYRAKEWNPGLVLYVVDFRQSFHFATLFEIAKRWGYTDQNLVHVSFGSVLGRDGKPLQTRKGTSFELADLLDEAEELGLARYRESHAERKAHGHDVPELTPETIKDIANAIGIGAVKYADLCQNRTSDYKYDPAKMLATDGNTATYMQYAFARGRSIFRKGGIDEAILRSDPPALRLNTPTERMLALQLLRFGEALHAAASEQMPHLLTGYLWDLAKSYSQFFEQCPVLQADTDELKMSRLLLVDLVTRIIRQTLDLLGIRVVEQM